MTKLKPQHENDLPEIRPQQAHGAQGLQTVSVLVTGSAGSAVQVLTLIGTDIRNKTSILSLILLKNKEKKRNLVSKWEAGPLATSICLCKRLASSSASSGPWASFCHSLRLSCGALGTFSGSWGRSRFFCYNRCIETKPNDEMPSF